MKLLLTPILSIALFAGAQSAAMAGDSVDLAADASANQPGAQQSQIITQLKTSNPQLFAKIDANHDKSISSSELSSVNDATLKELNTYIGKNKSLKRQLDTNKDSTVSKEELSGILSKDKDAMNKDASMKDADSDTNALDNNSSKMDKQDMNKDMDQQDKWNKDKDMKSDSSDQSNDVSGPGTSPKEIEKGRQDLNAGKSTPVQPSK